MQIRNAVPKDALAVCDVLRRSISELCVADHDNDPAILGAWLANKTPENIRLWIDRGDHDLLVAVEAGEILGVGAVTKNGEITLNYVSPDARFRGVSRAMLVALETRARAHGNLECTLASTDTALRFYASAGYRLTGNPQGRFGTQSSHPMARRLVDR